LHAVGAGGEHATAFAVGGDRIVTVAHALDPSRPVTVDGRRARVLRVDRAADLALLALPGLRAAAVRTGSGAPGDVRRRGRRARVRRAITATVRGVPGERAARRAALELAARARPGDSGAPLLAGDGRVVGVLFAASRDRADTAYAVDGSALRALLAR
jgi:S1-C subfamily serine protease